VYKHSILKLM